MNPPLPRPEGATPVRFALLSAGGKVSSSTRFIRPLFNAVGIVRRLFQRVLLPIRIFPPQIEYVIFRPISARLTISVPGQFGLPWTTAPSYALTDLRTRRTAPLLYSMYSRRCSVLMHQAGNTTILINAFHGLNSKTNPPTAWNAQPPTAAGSIRHPGRPPVGRFDKGSAHCNLLISKGNRDPLHIKRLHFSPIQQLRRPEFQV